MLAILSIHDKGLDSEYFLCVFILYRTNIWELINIDVLYGSKQNLSEQIVSQIGRTGISNSMSKFHKFEIYK